VSGPSPLDARRFFAGRWEGQGELVAHGPARLVLAREPVRLEGRGEWLTERVWRVHERFAFGSGFGFERHMFMEQVADGRIHATADDMPLGAEIDLAPEGVRSRLGCASETRVARDGTLHAAIRLDFWRIPVATLRLAIRVERA
jgi:hypothetical protein